ncbi:MAG: hypothetical protein ACNI25_09955 [Halarcobacter sp.]
MDNTKNVSIIFCYARSGGTFLNKFLNGFDELVILSEAHPLHNKKGGIHSVKGQMKKWYGVDIVSEEYIDQIHEVVEWCNVNGKHLIIRDWSYIDFAKSYLNKNQPIGTSTNLKLLESNGFIVNKIAYVRNGIDICLSQGQSPKQFAYDYLNFVHYIVNLGIPVFKYENFCENFHELSLSILEALNLEDLEVHAYSFNSDKVIGDINLSRGNETNEIKILPRKFAFSFQIKKINNDEYLKKANDLLGYTTNYYDKKQETLNKFLKFKIKQLYRRIIK